MPNFDKVIENAWQTARAVFMHHELNASVFEAAEKRKHEIRAAIPAIETADHAANEVVFASLAENVVLGGMIPQDHELEACATEHLERCYPGKVRAALITLRAGIGAEMLALI